MSDESNKPLPIRATNKRASVSLAPEPMMQAPMPEAEGATPNNEALDAAWKAHRARLGCCGVGTPLERPEGWKP